MAGVGVNEFWQRLKQRKLVQWAIAWVAFAFALLQGIDIIAQRFNWPGAVERYLILALAIGFFVMLVLAWYHGERGAQRIGGAELLIIALLLAIGGTLIWRLGPAANGPHAAPFVQAGSPDKAKRNPGTNTAPDSAAGAPASGLRVNAAAQPIPAKSIAVLPFENLSDDKKNDYFVAGMQDLILTKLADIGDLKVIARTSTAKYASHPDDLKTIGKQLGVASILEGSVQKQGKQVLINVQLSMPTPKAICGRRITRARSTTCSASKARWRRRSRTRSMQNFPRRKRRAWLPYRPGTRRLTTCSCVPNTRPTRPNSAPATR